MKSKYERPKYERPRILRIAINPELWSELKERNLLKLVDEKVYDVLEKLVEEEAI